LRSVLHAADTSGVASTHPRAYCGKQYARQLTGPDKFRAKEWLDWC
jgi:hypothetical protein